MKYLVFFCFALALAHPFHYYASHGSRKCFYKDLTQGTVLVGRYRIEIWDLDTNSYITPRDKIDTGTLIDVEEVFDSDHRVVHQRGLASGQFTFGALASGEHRICITPKSFYKKKWLDGGGGNPNAFKDSKFDEARVTLNFLITDGTALDGPRKVYRSLEASVGVLNDKMVDIRREQQFIREKESQFRDLSERTNERVVRWLVIQLGALLIACIFQLIKLQTFFVKEKIS